MDITLEDLLALEPRLSAVRGTTQPGSVVDQTGPSAVSWAVSARTTPPHLPLLRGGEIVLIPPRVVAILGPALFDLLREVGHRHVSAVVFARADVLAARNCPAPMAVPQLEWADRLNGDAETSINRTLTECRGTLYRVGSELERILTDIADKRGGIALFVRVAGASTGIPIEVRDAQGRPVASSPERPAGDGGNDPATTDDRVLVHLPSGASLLLGPLEPGQRVLARFLEDRLARAAEAALWRDDAVRPRGARRAGALAELLADQGHTFRDRRALALSLELNPDAWYLVAVTRGGSSGSVSKIVARLGAAHLVETTGEQHVTLIETSALNGASITSRLAEAKRQWILEHRDDGALLAFSAATSGVERLPAAAREARFVMKLQEAGDLQRSAASFESVEELGASRLLYQLRGSNELRSFVVDVLGSLRQSDPRGTLRATLRAFLESGGSHVDASRRLGIHRNTLAYRLRRAGDLVGHDVADPRSWLALHLALQAEELLGSAPGES